ncbi:MAG: hypothetical protein DME72_03065 [Verrucomicrobia bacterium]|nr:MAG: hypothetical protein DME72_03065 [Verrucomicrobiota bacterium]
MTEQELAIDAIRRLNRAQIAYLLTGSMASNYWGIPRTTHDLDFVVQLPVQSIPSLLHEFRDDFYLDEPAVRAALAPPYQFNAIDRRSALKIDFWMLRSDPFEISMFERRLRVSFLGELTWIATAEDVILHKLYWDSLTPSERQISDAAGVVAVQSDSLDPAYLQQWAGELRVSEKLNKLLVGEIKPKST